MKKTLIVLLLIIISPILFSSKESCADVIQADEDGYEYYQETKFIDGTVGTYSMAALSEDGRLFTWGDNVSTPTDVTSNFNLNYDETIIMLSSTIVVTSEGRVLKGFTSPVDMTGDFSFAPGETIEAISEGYQYSMLLTSLGTVYTWGVNSSYQLGDGTNTGSSSPIDITGNFTLGASEIIVSISAGSTHAIALSNEGTIFTWGANTYGQLGNGTFDTVTTPTSIMSMFTLAVDEEIIIIYAAQSNTIIGTNAGRVFSWGRNQFGTVGDNTTVNRSTPVDISAYFSMLPLEEVVSIGGMNSIILVTNKGRIFGWGQNTYGEVGDGTVIRRESPVQTNSYFPNIPGKIIKVRGGPRNSMTITDTGHLYTWGDNDNGAVGDGYMGTSYDRRLPVLMPDDFGKILIANIIYESTTLLSNNFEHAIVVTDNDIIYAWGDNEYGQLGDDSNIFRKTPVNITSSFTFNALETIIQVDTGETHSIVLTSDNRVFTWGNNTYGQLGNNTTTSSSIPIDITSYIPLEVGDYIVKIYAGKENSFLISNNNVVYSFGNNNYGQIGNNTSDNQLEPLDITPFFNLSVDDNIESLAVQYYHVLALSTDGNVYAWGYNSYGQLGDYTTALKRAPILIIEPEDLDIGELVIIIEVGSNFSGALTNQGNIYMWGANTNGELGDGTNTNRRTPTNVTHNFALAVGETIIDLSLGGSHTIIRTSDDRIFAWGLSSSGQLGTGYTVNMNDPYDITIKFNLEVGSNFDQFVLGDSNSYLITDDGYVYGWGRNSSYELGFGNTDEYLLPARLTKLADDLDAIKIFEIRLETNISTSHVEIILYPEFNITEYLQSITVDAVEYLKADLEISGGRIKVLVPNTYSENDIITFTLDSIKLIDDSIITSTGNVSGETKFLVDNTPPTFDFIGDQVIEVLEFTDIDWTTYMTNIEDDFIDFTLIEVEDFVNYNNIGLYSVTVKAVDESLNETSRTFNVNVVDTTPPEIEYYGPTVFDINNYGMDLTYFTTTVDNYDGLLLAEYSPWAIPWGFPGSFEVEIFAYDSSGNYGFEIITVDIVDSDPPYFFLIEDQIIEAGVDDIDWRTYITGEYDNFEYTQFSSEELSDPVLYETAGDYLVTVRLYDDSSNYFDRTFTVSVIDTTDPTFDPIIDQTIESGEHINIDWTTYVINITDNSDDDLIITIDESIVYDVPGIYPVTITVSDDSLNTVVQEFNVEVVDTIAPTFDSIADQIIEIGSSTDIDWTTLITNIDDNSSTSPILGEIDNVIYNTAGVYIVTLTVTDESSNVAEAIFNVTVVDTEDPIITLIGDEIIYIELGDTYEEPGTLFSDNHTEYDLNIVGTVNSDAIGTYNLTYMITDSSGNTSSVSRTVIVEDTTPPTVTIRPNLDTIYIGDIYVDTSVLIIDEDEVELVTSSQVNANIAGEYLITYTVTDSSGNITIVKRIVTVYEKEAFVFFIINKGRTTLKVGETYEDQGCTVFVNFVSSPCTISNNTINTTIPGVYIVTYSVTVGTDTYSYDRYVFVYTEGIDLVLYYNKEDWELII